MLAGAEGCRTNGTIEEDDKTYTKDLLGGRQDNEQKILGVRWNFALDELVFDLNEFAILVNKIEPTKRQIVAVTTRPIRIHFTYCHQVQDIVPGDV